MRGGGKWQVAGSKLSLAASDELCPRQLRPLGVCFGHCRDRCASPWCYTKNLFVGSKMMDGRSQRWLIVAQAFQSLMLFSFMAPLVPIMGYLCGPDDPVRDTHIQHCWVDPRGWLVMSVLYVIVLAVVARRFSKGGLQGCRQSHPEASD